MASEFIALGTTGLTLAAHFFRLSDGQVWNGSTYAEPSSVNAATLAGYRTALTEVQDSAGNCVGYELAIPAGIVVPVHIAVYVGSATTETYSGEYDPQVAQILADTATDGVVLSTATQQAIATTLLDLASTIDGKTLREAVRYMAASLAGKIAGAGTGTEKAYGLDGTTERVRYTADEAGNRTAVSYDPT